MGSYVIGILNTGNESKFAVFVGPHSVSVRVKNKNNCVGRIYAEFNFACGGSCYFKGISFFKALGVFNFDFNVVFAFGKSNNVAFASVKSNGIARILYGRIGGDGDFIGTGGCGIFGDIRFEGFRVDFNGAASSVFNCKFSKGGGSFYVKFINLDISLNAGFNCEFAGGCGVGFDEVVYIKTIRLPFFFGRFGSVNVSPFCDDFGTFRCVSGKAGFDIDPRLVIRYINVIFIYFIGKSRFELIIHVVCFVVCVTDAYVKTKSAEVGFNFGYVNFAFSRNFADFCGDCCFADFNAGYNAVCVDSSNGFIGRRPDKFARFFFRNNGCGEFCGFSFGYGKGSFIKGYGKLRSFFSFNGNLRKSRSGNNRIRIFIAVIAIAPQIIRTCFPKSDCCFTFTVGGELTDRFSIFFSVINSIICFVIYYRVRTHCGIGTHKFYVKFSVFFCSIVVNKISFVVRKFMEAVVGVLIKIPARKASHIDIIPRRKDDSVGGCSGRIAIFCSKIFIYRESAVMKIVEVFVKSEYAPFKITVRRTTGKTNVIPISSVYIFMGINNKLEGGNIILSVPICIITIFAKSVFAQIHSSNRR